MRKIVSEKEHQEWIERYLAGETCRQIAQDYPYNENTISKYIRAQGLSRGKGNLPKYLELKPIVLKEYQENSKVTLSELAKKYGISDRTVSAWVKEAGIQVKQIQGFISNCKEDYFNTIDTPNKAYILGFITADGSVVSLDKEGNARTCAIEIHEKDKELLNFIKAEINPKATISPCFYGKKRNYRVTFNSKKLCNDLKKYGIIPNKSKKITAVPRDLISKKYLPFYFRGLFDGDGCAHKNGGLSFYSGSEQFILSVQSILIEEANLTKLSVYKGTTYFITWTSKKDRTNLFHYLYDNLQDTYYFPRKYNRIRQSLQDNTEVSNQIAKG